MKQHKNHCNVRVLSSGSHHVHVIVLDEGIRAVLGTNERSQGAVLLLVCHQADKLVDDRVVYVASVVSGDEDFALHVEEVDGR